MGPQGGPGYPGIMGPQGGPGYPGMMGPQGGPGMMPGGGAPMMGPEMMQNRGAMALMQAIQLSDLTDEQRKELGKLAQELRKETWAQMGPMMDEESKLAELYAQDPVDEKAVGEVYARIFDLKRQTIESHIRTENRVKSILTPEQWTQLQGGPGQTTAPAAAAPKTPGRWGPGRVGTSRMMRP